MSKVVKVSALLLCAGKSSRTSPDHKLMFKIQDLSVIKRTAHAIIGAQFFEVIAITGHEADMIRDELHGMPVHFVHNEKFEKGIHSSIKAGLTEISPEADFFAVCLADQPMLRSDDYNLLIDTVGENKKKKLFRPVYNGKFGNPAIISRDLILEILRHEDSDKGCSYLFEKHPDEVVAVEMPDHSSLVDVDTHELFEEVKFHLEKRD